MIYPAHTDYKDSEDEWLGDIPSHWDVSRTKFMLSLKKDLVGEKSADFKLLSLTLKGVILRDMESGKGKFPAEFNTYQIVSRNNLIFCLFDIDETPRTIGLSNYDGMITGAYNVYECSNKCVPEFAYYYFLHIDSFKGLRPFYTGLRKVVRADTFANIKMPCPPISEQKQIADFIDHETAKVDSLIEKSEQLISLLLEKRQAMISHAVTKGLNPDAPMKDSGIEWLGEIPEHWKIKRLKHLGTAKNGLTYAPEDTSEKGTLVLRSSNVQNKKITYDDNVFVNKPIPEKLVTQINDILICSRNGSRNLIGKNALIDKKSSGCTYGAFMMVFRGDINPYLFWILNSTLFEYQSGSFLTSTINQLTVGNINSFEVPIPPVEERHDIIEHLKKVTEEIDQLIDKALQKNDKLKEHQSALISAAVTGKIDVREWNEKEKAA